MTDHDFIRLIQKTSLKMAIIGTGIAAFGCFTFWLGLSGDTSAAEQMSTAGAITFLIFAGLFLLAGLLLITLAINASLNIKNGKHQLVNAIQRNDQSYVLWIYEYITKVRSGPASNTDHKIWVMCRDKKHFSIDVKKTKAQEVIDYLTIKFPAVVVGYSKELEDAYHQKVSEIKT